MVIYNFYFNFDFVLLNGKFYWNLLLKGKICKYYFVSLFVGVGVINGCLVERKVICILIIWERFEFLKVYMNVVIKGNKIWLLYIVMS